MIELFRLGLMANKCPLRSMEVRRRERVIRIFPNDDSALRLIGALLAEQNEIWQERRYLDMSEYHEWVALRVAAREGNNVVALSG